MKFVTGLKQLLNDLRLFYLKAFMRFKAAMGLTSISLCLFSLPLQALVDESAFAAKVQVSNEEITIDHHLTVTLKLTYPSEYHPDESLLLDHLLNKGEWEEDEPFTLSEKKISPPIKSEDNRLSQTFTYVLEPWQKGRQIISFRNIRFLKNTQEQSEPVEIWTDLHIVNIAESPRQNKTEEIKPELLPPPGITLLGLDSATKHLLETKNNSLREVPRNLEIAKNRSFPWKSLFFIAILIAMIWFIKEKLQAIISKYKNYFFPPPTPKEKAFARLKELAEQKLPEKELFEPYYVRLTQVVRSYIEEEYLIQAEEYTTEEFLQNLQIHELFTEEMRKNLKEFLFQADLVKFARQSANQEECNQAYTAAERFVAT